MKHDPSLKLAEELVPKNGKRYQLTPNEALARLDEFLLINPAPLPRHQVFSRIRRTCVSLATAHWMNRARTYLLKHKEQQDLVFAFTWHEKKQPDDALRFSKMICEVFAITDAETLPIRDIDRPIHKTASA